MQQRMTRSFRLRSAQPEAPRITARTLARGAVLAALTALASACGDGDENTSSEAASGGSTSDGKGSGAQRPPPSELEFDSNADNGGDDPTGDVDPSTAPPFAPQLLVNTLVGGTGDQYVRRVYFDEDGTVVGLGQGFEVRYDPSSGSVEVSGDPSIADDSEFRGNNKLRHIGNSVDDPRNGQTYEIGYRQVGGNLQQPYLDASGGWKFWGWSEDEAGNLRADSRGYDISLMPNGQIMALAWTDGGNSTLTRDPQDLSEELQATQGAIQSSAAGVATLYLLIDPEAGRPVSGTFLYTQSMNRAIDRWGRVYITDRITKNTTATNPFGQSEDASAGFIVLRPDLKRAELNVRLGANCKDIGKGTLASVAVRDDLLVLGGTHCDAPIVATENAVQDGPGGGQDGYFVVIKLR